MGTKCVSGVH